MDRRYWYHGRFVSIQNKILEFIIELTDLQDFLDCVLEDSVVENDHDGGDESGHTTPTAKPRTPNPANSAKQQPLPQLSSSNLVRTTVHDVSVDVIIAPLARSTNGSLRKPERNVSYSNAVQASCIISIWSIEDIQYFTLTFTSATTTDSAQSLQPSSRSVNKTSTISQSNKSRGSSSSTSSGHRSGSSSNSASKAVTPILQQPDFPPRGPPLKSRGDISSSASIFQKASQMKDAILSSINMPAYGM
jgi:hypothetical protein